MYTPTNLTPENKAKWEAILVKLRELQESGRFEMKIDDIEKEPKSNSDGLVEIQIDMNKETETLIAEMAGLLGKSVPDFLTELFTSAVEHSKEIIETAEQEKTHPAK